MFAAGKTSNASAGGAPDAQFNYVTMLLHGDGTNGAQNNTFLDSSTNNFTITRNGNTTQGSFSPYGSNWSNNFVSSGGAGAYLTTPSSSTMQLGSGDFTIECWVFLTKVAENAFIGRSPFDNTNNEWVFQTGTANELRFAYSTNGSDTQTILATATTVSLSTWTHVAVVRNSSTLTFYINGTSVGTNSISATIYSGNTTTTIGSYAQSAFPNGYAVPNGYLSNIRVVKGTAVYTSNFTPSTTPLTAISGTSMLTCQSNRFIDNSTNNFTVTAVNGSPSVQRFNPFGTATAYSTSVIGGSGYFDGSGDYLTASATNIANFGTADFIVSAWFYSTTTGSYQKIFDNYNGNNNVNPTLLLNIGGAGIVSWYAGQSALINSSSTYMPNTWNYVVVSRVSSTTKMFLNGTQVGSVADTRTYVAGNANIGIGGEPYSSGGAPMVGYITDLQVVKGSGVTSSTVPTAPVSASGTTLALSFQNGAIFDNAMMNDLETVGNAQISTSVYKYGTGSLYFDGSGDRLIGSPTLLYDLSGNFTIECWVYFNSVAGQYTGIVSYADSSGWFGWQLQKFGNQIAFEFLSSNAAVGNVTSSSTVTAGLWYHVAAVRNGSTITIYINGIAQGTSTTSASYSSASSFIRVGDERTLTYPLNAYVDELRVTKGYARYTANFTPPTAAFPNTGPV